MPDSIKERLFELLRQRSFVCGEVVLASGQKSDYYFDGKMVEACPEGAYLIGEAIYEHTKHLQFDAIGGLAVGAVPLVTSAAVSFYHHGRNIEGFWVREETKAHGTRKLIEGKLPEKARVVIVDDVITSGGSSQKAIDAVEAQGATVVLVLAIVDRQQGARERFEGKYRYEALFTKDEFFR